MNDHDQCQVCGKYLYGPSEARLYKNVQLLKERQSLRALEQALGALHTALGQPMHPTLRKTLLTHILSAEQALLMFKMELTQTAA